MIDRKPIRALIVDDQADAREWLAEWLRVQHGYIVDTAANGQEATRYVRAAQGNYDAIVMDQLLNPGPDGIQTMMTIRAEYPNIETIVITGFGSLVAGIAAMRAGAFRYIFKPLNREELVINIEMAAERHRLKYSLGRREEQLKALQCVGQEINRSLDPAKVQDMILEKALELTGAHFGTILQWNTEKNALIFSRVRPPIAKLSVSTYVKQIPVPDGIDGCVGISGRAALERRTVRVADVTEDPDYIAYISNTRSELAVPLLYSNECIGVLDVEHREVDAFSEEDQKVLEALADQAATALWNALQYEKLKTTLEELERTKQTLIARTAIAQMGILISTLAHSIGRDMATIGDHLYLLRSDLARRRPKGALLERLDRIDRILHRLLDILAVVPQSKDERAESIYVNSLLRELLAEWHNTYEGVGVESCLELDDNVTTRAVRAFLVQTFSIVVQNAVESMLETPTKHLKIITRDNVNFVEIHFIDTGVGIPKEVLPQLFKMPIPKDKDERGAGLGLLMASSILQSCGGTIKVGNTSTQGTTFIISLPKEI
jgi:GAF domain-containing protein/FixJ family two-component response regulator